MEQAILDFINNIYELIRWPGVVLMMAIESACIPLPSEIIMPLAGWMLIRDAGLPAVYLLLAGVYGMIGNIIGSIVAYAVGMWGGRPFLLRYGKYILITRHDLDQADAWFKKYGSLSMFVSRLLPAIRTFISLPAGIARMNFIKFVAYSAVGSFIWSLALAWAGYQVGAHWEQIRNIMRPFDWLIIAAVVLAVAYYIYRHVKHFKEAKDADNSGPTSSG